MLKKKEVVITLTVLVFIILIMLGCFITKLGPLQFLLSIFSIKYLPELEEKVNLWTVFVFGFFTSFHCIGMCSGVIISQCTNYTGKLQMLGKNVLYQLGRLLCYGIVGLVAGTFGSLFRLNAAFGGLIPLCCSIVMLVSALNMLGLFRALRYAFSTKTYGKIAQLIQSINRRSSLFVGFLTGLLPCGMLQMMQLYALGTQSPWMGTAVMIMFALGTMPVLFLFGFLSGMLTVKNQRLMQLILGFLLIILSVRMLIKAIGLF